MANAAAEQIEITPDTPASSIPKEKSADHPSAIDERLADERAQRTARFALTTHKPNYMVLSRVGQPNEQFGDLNTTELKFQLSFKVNLVDDVFGGALVFGFTQQSYWQAFNTAISSPFRETNYEPEIMWVFTHPRKSDNLFARQIVAGFSHQSNGRSQPDSRSWNRVYLNFIAEYDDFYFSFKPWYRIPEPDKAFAGDPAGDDNPDIGRYLGTFELTATWARHGVERVGLMWRNYLNFSDNRGAVQIDWSYPLRGRLKGYVQYFNGYGDSLIDYNYSLRRLSIGFMLNNWL